MAFGIGTELLFFGFVEFSFVHNGTPFDFICPCNRTDTSEVLT